MTLNFPFCFSQTSKLKAARSDESAETRREKPSFAHALVLSAAKAESGSEDKPTLTAPPVRKAPMPPAAVLLVRAWAWLKKNQRFTAAKKLRVSDTVTLGDKRFVAVVHVEGQRFLIGGGSSGVSLLAQLDRPIDSETALQGAMQMGSLAE